MKSNDRKDTPKPTAEQAGACGQSRRRAGVPTPSTNDFNPLSAADRAQKRRAAKFLTRLRRSVLPVALLLAATFGATAKAPSITASIDPSEIAFGETAQLTVTVQGQDQNTPEIPAVSGLSFQPMGQSSQIQILNGAMSATTSHTYSVMPSRIGSFTIPKIRIGSGRDAVESQPLVLKVLKRVGAPTATPTLPDPAVNGADDTADAQDQNSFGYLRLVSPKKEFYVGELVPVELKAYFRAGVELRVDGLPRLNGDAFTMNKLGDQPSRSQQVIGGVPYTVFTWSTAITAVKAGDYQMSVQIPTTVTLRQRVQRPRMPDSFGDSFFDEVFNDRFFNDFFGTATQKEVALSSRSANVRILSLPTEGRPAGYSGAVGKFDFAAEAAPRRVAAGDPVTLKLKVTGSGNFDRVNAPALEKSDAWKTYTPSVKFEPEDSVGYSGTKTFEQALVPAQSGTLQVPALAFSFFDPQTRQYATRTTATISIEVAPGQTASAATPPPTSAGNPTAGSRGVAASPELVPNKVRPGSFKSSLRPWFLSPWLAGCALLPVVVLLAINEVVRRRQRLARDPNLLRLTQRRRAVQEHMRIMEGAVSQGAVAEFFAAARGAFQHQLGLRWGLPPQTITLADINARMNGDAEGFRFIFELADEVTYTGRTFAAGELHKWFKTVQTELKKLEER
jgi:hypothetical protein